MSRNPKIILRFNDSLEQLPELRKAETVLSY